MIRNYFKTALRNISKHRSYSFINIAGLAIGIASFIIIVMYVVDELQYDRYHYNSENIYRLVNIYDSEGVGENSASSPFPVAFTLKNDYPGMISETVRVFNFQSPSFLIRKEEKLFNEKRVFFADSTFFSIFNHQFLYGNGDDALDEMNSVVITESMAEKYFGNKNPMGETIRFEEQLDFKVTGVIENVPYQSHFVFDFIASMSTVRAMYGDREPQTWVWNPCWTYFVVEEGRAETLESNFPAFIDKYFFDAEKENVSLYLQKLNDIHLKSNLDYEIEPNSNSSYIYILSVIAVFLLIIASINFMNLATATSSCRAKEIGIKKVVGGHRSQLIFQFLGEAIILSFISLIIAVILVELLLPQFNTFTGKEIQINTLFQPNYMLGILLVGLFTGLFAGAYPAFYLSSFEPITVLKGKLSSSRSNTNARKILVVLQFTISISLIIGTIVVFNQTTHMRQADLGFNKNDIVYIPIQRTPIAREFTTFKNELLQNPNILSVTAVDDILGAGHNTHEFRPEGFPEDKWQFYPALVVKHDFVKTFDLRIIAGRDFNRSNKTDEMSGILINEAMVKHIGWSSNEEALGKKFRSLSGEERVIGIFNNFYASSVHEASGPFVLNMKENPDEIMFFLKYMAVRISPDNYKESIDFIESKWAEFETSRPFEYTFLDKELSKLYDDEENLGSLSMIFTILIIFIAALGLFGLAAFLANQRTKEVGIRKVMGADIWSIILLMSKEFFVLILISIFIAWGISYFMINEWLQQFANRVDMNYLTFIIAGILALILSFVITSYKAFSVSRINPINSLKYE